MKNGRDLTEAQFRYLCRIADQMRDQACCEVSLTLHHGGVRAYSESRRFDATNLPEADGALANKIEGA